MIRIDVLDTIEFDYVNWKGEKGRRKVVVTSIAYGSNEWHTEPQWILYGKDLDKMEPRGFAMKDMSNVVKLPHSWYQKAAEDYIKFIDHESGGRAKEDFIGIKNSMQTNPRFHFDLGMVIRNELRDLGYYDEEYGNLDDHYQEILKVCFEKAGI